MNLYNILIVDDEAFIVDWIANLLETQNDLNISIYRSYTTSKAREMIRHIRIDLLISDIQMPSYSGFELSEEMHNLWPNSKTILLTAFSDFNYAKKAIQQGIFSYILKTAEDSEILSEIRRVLNTIEQELHQQLLYNNIEKDLKDFQSKLNTQIFFSWLNGNYTKASLAEQIDVLGFSLSKSTHFLMLICRLDSFATTNINQLSEAMKPFQVQNIIYHNLAPHLLQAAYEITGNLLLGILQLHHQVSDQITQVISSALESAQATCQESLNWHISCLLSSLCTANELPTLWSQGKSLLTGFSDKTDFVYVYKSPENNYILRLDDNHISQLYKSDFYKTMYQYLDAGNRTAFIELLDQICDYLCQHANWHNNYSLQIYFSLVLVFTAYINQKDLSSQIAFHTSTGMLFRPWLADSWPDLQNLLYQTADALFLLKGENENIIVKKIRSYIDTHITEDISLMDLTHVTGYSASYLSKYYSDSTGTTISEYIASKKMEKITQLMQDTNMNLGEIAITLGFHSRTYFNYYIKRLTGMSPQQYRESITKNQSS